MHTHDDFTVHTRIHTYTHALYTIVNTLGYIYIEVK